MAQTISIIDVILAKALAISASKAYTDQKTQSLMGGVHYRGQVDYYDDLPNNPEEGDSYTVKYAGSSGTVADGTEYTWGVDSSTNTMTWISFSKDAYSKAETDLLLAAKQSLIDASNKLDGSLVGPLTGYVAAVTAAALDPTDTLLQALGKLEKAADDNKNNILLKANTADVNTTTANLQSQIDNIITPVTQDAEVENARVGANGERFTTLKSRIDVVQNTAEQANNAAFMRTYSDSNFVFKHIGSGGELMNNGNKNISFENKVVALKGSSVYVDSGYKYQMALYNISTGSFIERISWATVPYILNNDYQIRLEISDNSETVLVDDSIKEHLHYSLIATEKPIIDEVISRTDSIVNALGIDTFKGKTVDVAEPYKYKAWSFVGKVANKAICVYSVGESHEDNTTPDIYCQLSNNGVLWLPAKKIISTYNVRDTVTGKGYDNGGNFIFWVRKGAAGDDSAVHDLYKTSDGLTFELVSSPTFSKVPSHIGDIVNIPNVGLLAFWNDTKSAGSRSWGVVKSTDNGETWTQTVVETGLQIYECPMEMSPVYLGNGKLLIMGRQEGASSYGMFQIQSNDSGETYLKSSTNITDIYLSTPSILYDGTTLSLYYFRRYYGELRLRTIAPADIWDNPTNWSDSSVIAHGTTNPQDTGNVNADTFGGVQLATFYSGDSTDTGIYVTIM